MPRSIAPIQPPQKDAGEPNTGEAAAAVKNRAIQARLQIINAFQRLRIPNSQWPDFVRAFYTNPQEREGYTESTESILPPSFQPPAFERLNESPEQWAKAADAAWQKHRNAFLEQCQFWVTVGVDEEILPRNRPAVLAGKGVSGTRLPTYARSGPLVD
jgi:hypothetical protein